jgi:hypothetical protein
MVSRNLLGRNIWPNNLEVVAAGHEVGILDVVGGGEEARRVHHCAGAEQDAVAVDDEHAPVGGERAKDLGGAEATGDAIQRDRRARRLIEAHVLAGAEPGGMRLEQHGGNSEEGRSAEGGALHAGTIARATFNRAQGVSKASAGPSSKITADGHVLAVDPTKIAQPLHQGGKPGACDRSRRRSVQDAHDPAPQISTTQYRGRFLTGTPACPVALAQRPVP